MGGGTGRRRPGPRHVEEGGPGRAPEGWRKEPKAETEAEGRRKEPKRAERETGRGGKSRRWQWGCGQRKSGKPSGAGNSRSGSGRGQKVGIEMIGKERKAASGGWQEGIQWQEAGRGDGI